MAHRLAPRAETGLDEIWGDWRRTKFCDSGYREIILGVFARIARDIRALKS
jgi:hypothetical protein